MATEAVVVLVYSPSAVELPPWLQNAELERESASFYLHASRLAFCALKKRTLTSYLLDSDRWRCTVRICNGCGILHAETINSDNNANRDASRDTDCDEHKPSIIKPVPAQPHACMELAASHCAWRTSTRVHRRTACGHHWTQQSAETSEQYRISAFDAEFAIVHERTW